MTTLSVDPLKRDLPAPRRAAEELPDLDRARALGIELADLETARTVACLLSRYLARGRSRQRSNLKAMMTALAAACAIEVVHDRETEPAPHPELAGRTWPSASAAYRRLGIDARGLEEYWRTARHRSTDTCYPLEWLLAFFPAELWPAVATLIGWGPERAGVRLEQATMALARQTTVMDRRRRPKGSPIAYGTVDAWVSALMNLLRELVTLRAALVASKRPALRLQLVEAWSACPAKPNLRDCGVRLSGQDNTGPPLEDVQRRLHELVRDYEANRKYTYARLRRVLLLSILALLGPRHDALRTVRVADFKPDAPAPDGTRRAVLEIRPGKTWDADEVHTLPLPDRVAEWLREWIRITGRELGDHGPLFPAKMPTPGREVEPLTQIGFYGAIAGRGKGSGGTYALIPLDGDPFVGYRPHAYRHTAQQLIERAAVELKAERPAEFAHLTPQDFTRAVLGHRLTRSTPDVYRDLDRRRLTFAVIDKAWQILWGDGAAPQGLDPEAIRKSRAHVEMLAAAIRALGIDQQRLRRSQHALRDRASRLAGDDLSRALIESHLLVGELEQLTLERERLTTQLAAAEQEHAEARTRLVPIPNGISEADHAELVAHALEPHTDTTDTGEGDLADELTPRDLAEIWDTTEQTINNWTRNGFPRGVGAPWDNAAWIVEGPRRKRLPVSAIDHSLLSAGQQSRLADVRRRRCAHDLLRSGQKT